MTMNVARMQSGLKHFWRQAVRTARLAIGVADYDTYVRHLRMHHPERAIPSYEEFFTQSSSDVTRTAAIGGAAEKP